MFTDFRKKKTLLANWLPWQQGNVYFWFINLKILLIPSFEKLPSFKVLACSVVEFWAIYWAWGGKHPPPPVLIGLIVWLGIVIDHPNRHADTAKSRLTMRVISFIESFDGVYLPLNPSFPGKDLPAGEHWHSLSNCTTLKIVLIHSCFAFGFVIEKVLHKDLRGSLGRLTWA